VLIYGIAKYFFRKPSVSPHADFILKALVVI